MPAFGRESLRKLETADPQLQRLFVEVVKHFDCTILEGRRTAEQQQRNVDKGVSKTLASKHVRPEPMPSAAVDVAPYPLKWPQKGSATFAKDVQRFLYFGGYVLGVAEMLDIPIRWGGDWDGDRDILDQTFDDLVHFELA